MKAERIVAADPDECVERMCVRGMRVRHNQMAPGAFAVQRLQFVPRQRLAQLAPQRGGVLAVMV